MLGPDIEHRSSHQTLQRRQPRRARRHIIGADQSVQRAVHPVYRQRANLRFLHGIARGQAGFNFRLKFANPRNFGRALGKHKLVVEALQRERAHEIKRRLSAQSAIKQ